MDWDLAHVITKLELGGAQLATLHQIAHLPGIAGRRYLLFGPGGMLDPEARKLPQVEPIEVAALAREIDPTRDLVAFKELVLALRALRRRNRARPLLVHTHSSKAGILGRWAAAMAGVECIVHSIHGFGHTREQSPAVRRALLALEQATAHVTDGFTADSAANLDQAAREAILVDTPARVVRCAIEPSRFETPTRPRAMVRAELGLADDEGVVLSLSCLKPQKDPLALVRVAAMVLRERPTTTFLLAGDGELRPQVEKLVAFLELGHRVRLLGWRRDVADLLHAADLLVSTSRWEGLPQVFPQAMAARRPIVATNVDGAAEAIDHGESGLLYSVGDLEGMARGIVALLCDSAQRVRLGEAGHARVGEFSCERMIQDLDAFYAELILRRRRRWRAHRAAAQARLWWAALKAGKTP